MEPWRSHSRLKVIVPVFENIQHGPLTRLLPLLETTVAPSLRLSFGLRRPGGSASSKFGGVPDLPSETPWPTHNEQPLDFLAQCRLADLGRLGPACGLQADGMLYFFHSLDQQPGGYEVIDRGSWRVLFAAGEVMPSERPTGPQRGALEEQAIEFSEAPSMLSIRQLETIGVRLTDPEFEAYLSLREPLDGDQPLHRMFGHPDSVSQDVRHVCEVISRGYDYSPATLSEPTVRSVSREHLDEWVLLLQLDTFKQTTGHVTWGDGGRLYFMIKRSDLAAHNFDDVWAVIQD